MFIGRFLIFLVMLGVCLAGCKASGQDVCVVTETIWEKPPADIAVSGVPVEGHYFVNQDRSIWASAWWVDQDEVYLKAGEEIKVGWFRPDGADLEIVGQRLDRKAAPLEAHIPCCYPTKFQATGLYFPAEGCWQISAQAAESMLTFVVWVEP
jgi:hypothetical protein